MSTEDSEVRQWLDYASEDLAFEVPEEIQDAILQLAQITPAVRYPSDD